MGKKKPKKKQSEEKRINVGGGLAGLPVGDGLATPAGDVDPEKIITAGLIDTRNAELIRAATGKLPDVPTTDRSSLMEKVFEQLQSPLAKIRAVNHVVAKMEGEVAEKIRQVLEEIAGADFASMEERREVADEINAVVKSIRRKVLCPTCGLPGRFRAVKAPRVETGLFRFDHGDTTHSVGTTLPKLRISE